MLLFDLLTWAGSMTCYIWDCQNAGRITRAAVIEAEEIDSQLRAAAVENPSVAELHPAFYAQRQIHFAACAAQETIPRVAGMPDDLFTSCLLTPLRIALLFHNLETFPFTRSIAAVQVQRSSAYMAELWDVMSPELKERLWAELRVILHTIAWQSLSGHEYQSLVGQSCDVVSNLASGFLLSQRVMPAYRAHPESIPPMPISRNHTLWNHWDLILDNFFEQLPEYTAVGTLDLTWESRLTFVSFIGDQLDSILSTDQSRLPCDTRLPVICRACLIPEYRERACSAIDAYLRQLDVRGLSRAIQGGALDVASYLIALDDQDILPRMISIWASLVRHDACVRSLAKEGLHAERLTSVLAVKFFLGNLERNLEEVGGSKRTAIQSAAVLSTIAQFVAGRQAPRFVRRTLSSAIIMLNNPEDLVQQWGALLVAEVRGSIKHPDTDNKETLDALKDQLLVLSDVASVETRASAIYALTRWVSASLVKDVNPLTATLELTHQLAVQPHRDGSPLVRKELARLFYRALASGGMWTTLSVWIHLSNAATHTSPSEKDVHLQPIANIADRISLKQEQQEKIARLIELIKALHILRRDPDQNVAIIATDSISNISSDLRTYASEGAWDTISEIVFPLGASVERWTNEAVEKLKLTGSRLLDDWERRKAQEISSEEVPRNNELFERSKLSLQAYLAVSYSR